MHCTYYYQLTSAKSTGIQSGLDISKPDLALGEISLNTEFKLANLLEPSEMSAYKPYGKSGDAKVVISIKVSDLMLTQKAEFEDVLGVPYQLKSLDYKLKGAISGEAKVVGGLSGSLGSYRKAWKETEEQGRTLLGVSGKLLGLESKDKIGKIPLAGLVFSVKCPTISGCPVWPGNTVKPLDQAAAGGVIVWLYLNAKGEITFEGGVGARINAGFEIGAKQTEGGELAQVFKFAKKTPDKNLIETPFVQGELKAQANLGISLDVDAFAGGVRFLNLAVDTGAQANLNVNAQIANVLPDVGQSWKWQGNVCMTTSIGAGAIANLRLGIGGEVKTGWEKVDDKLTGRVSYVLQSPKESDRAIPGSHDVLGLPLWYTYAGKAMCFPTPVLEASSLTANGTVYNWVVTGKNLPDDLELSVSTSSVCATKPQLTWSAADAGAKATFSCSGLSSVSMISGSFSSAKASNLEGQTQWNWPLQSIQPENGLCGSSNQASFLFAPTSNLCSKGTPSSVTGDGPWNWTCSAGNGGSPASCTALKTTSNIDISVSGAFPMTLTRNAATTVTVTGANLPSTTVFAISNVVCSGNYSRSSTSVSQTCTAQDGSGTTEYLTIKDVPNGTSLLRSGQAVAFSIPAPIIPITVSSLSASQSGAGQAINGSFSVSGSSVSLVRVHAGVSASSTACYTDLATSTGFKSFSFTGNWINENGWNCASLLPTAGSTSSIVFKVEARDSANSLANNGTAPTTTASYQAGATPITVSSLSASQSGAGQAINGSFSVSGSSVSLVRVHAGVSASSTACYTDLAASTGSKSFSFTGNWINENGLSCASLLPTAGSTSSIVFKVEARDSANSLANNGTAPTTTASYQAGATPITVSSLSASQSGAGQAINGSFSVSGSSVSLVRVHAGVSASSTACYTDLAASTGFKSFSFTGNWINENGWNCASLLPTAGSTSSIVFKVEARDSANSLANNGTAPTTTASYQAGATPITVSSLSASQSGAGQAINGSFSVSGSSVSLVRVHAGVSASSTACYTDLAASTGFKSFSFTGNWINENGWNCASLLPTAGSTSSIVFKVEARDSANSLANNGTAPTTTASYQAAAAAIPITVSSLSASQSGAGQAINGSFSVSGSSVSLVRVHAGVSASSTACYTDLATSTGFKSFSFTGNWINENGWNCASLLPTAGSTSSIVFKVEARDSANSLANNGTAPTTTASYQAAAAIAIVNSASPGTLKRNSATTVTVMGANLPSTTVFAISNVVCSGNYSRSSTSVSQTCTAQSGTPSSVSLTVKDVPGGNLLVNGNQIIFFTVQW